MEIDEFTDSSAIKRWELDRLRTVRYDLTGTSLFARSQSLVQRTYRLDTDAQSRLGIRQVKGLPFKGTISNLIWLRAFSQSGATILIGVESAYVFERTGCLVTPSIASWGGGELVPVLEILQATLCELESLLGLRIEGLCSTEEVPSRNPCNYLAVDHQCECKVLLLTDTSALDAIEMHVRHYCVAYWQDREQMGRKIGLDLGIYLYPAKRSWSSTELASFELGDLVAIQNYAAGTKSKHIRGFLRLFGSQSLKSKYEVFMEIGEEDTRLHFGKDSFEDPEKVNPHVAIAPHEEIELEIHAGRTKILFNDLCSVQAGTLIELREHALPMVTLCVSGSPILEGELVHFQDQLMVQVTKRLD